MLYFSILLHCIDLSYELWCHLCATSFTILSSYSSIGHYMFRRKENRITVSSRILNRNNLYT
jgi:hypothetical protein